MKKLRNCLKDIVADVCTHNRLGGASHIARLECQSKHLRSIYRRNLYTHLLMGLRYQYHIIAQCVENGFQNMMPTQDVYSRNTIADADRR